MFVSVCRNSYDEYGNLDVSAQHERFRDLTYPPDFEKNLKMRDMLEEILAEAQEGEDEDEDKMKALEEFVEVRGSAGPASHPTEERQGFLTRLARVFCCDFVGDGRQGVVPPDDALGQRRFRLPRHAGQVDL